MLLAFTAAISADMPRQPAEAAKEKYITAREFDGKLKKITGSAKSFVKPSEKARLGKAITNEYAAMLLNRADVYKNGSAYNASLYKHIVAGKRISDIRSVDAKYRKAVRLVFLKGIMAGESNGAYSGGRKFSPKKKMTAQEASKALNRLRDKTKRVKLSYDGQVVRTTNLPKNYKSFPYILASFPNSFYEHGFVYDTLVFEDGRKPTNGRDYCSPAYLYKYGKYLGTPMKDVLNQYGDSLHDLIYKNLYYRFNFNYKTTNTSAWISKLRSTYYYDTLSKERNPEIIKDIRKWTENAKKYGVVVQAKDISVDLSTAYTCESKTNTSNCFVRGHATIRVTAKDFQKTDNGNVGNMIYGYSDDGPWIPELENGKWYTFDFEVNIGTHVYNDPVSEWAMYDFYDLGACMD